MSEMSAEETPDIPKQRSGPFRLVHFLYAIALFTSSVTTFGPYGIVPVVLIWGFWAVVFFSRSRPSRLLAVSSVIFIGFCLISMLLPAVSRAGEAARRSQCKNNLKQIALALHNYHDTYGSYPPAFIADEEGKPMHSWRVLLLPFLDQQDLYKAYDFDQPWDGPHNSQILERIMPIYRCPGELKYQSQESAAARMTNYLAVVGPRTAFPGDGSTSFSDMQDETTSVIAVVEVTDSGIHWMEPRDISFEDAVRLLSSTEPQSAHGHRWDDFFYSHSPGRHVALADGRVYLLPHGVDRETISKLLSTDDGGTWEDVDDYGDEFSDTKKLRVGNACRFGLFVFLILFPLPWVWLNPTSTKPSRK